MSDGDQTCVLLSNSGNRKIWYKNQCVTTQFYDDCTVVTSEQARSTPGIKASLHLKANQRFHLRTYGKSFRQACAFVWVYLLSSKKRLIPNYTMLPSDDSGETCVDIEFCTPKSRKSHLQVFIGVLFTGPPKCGDQFQLQKMELTYMQDCVFPTEGGGGGSKATCPPPHSSSPPLCTPNRADPYYDCYDGNPDDEYGAATACNASPCIAQPAPPVARQNACSVPVSINDLTNVCDRIISNLDNGNGND